MPKTTRPVLHQIFVVLVIFSLITATGCTPAQPTAQQQPEAAAQPAVEAQPGAEVQAATDAPPTADPDTAGLAAETEVRFQAEDFTPVEFPIEPLGSIAFTVDASAGTVQEIVPGAEPVQLQLVDAAGLTWTLEIPGGALESAQQVAMLPLSELDGSGISALAGEVRGGIRLEPDGLAFHKPVRLSVSGAGLTGPTFILSGSHDGTGVNYSLQDTTAEQSSARILHFSTYFASQPEEKAVSEANKNAWNAYKGLEAEAKKLLKSPLDVPAPPSIPLECQDEQTGQQNGKAISSFVESAMNAENNLANQLLTQRGILYLTGSAEMGDVGDLEIALVERIGRKATAMMKQYAGQEDKLVAVSQLAVNAARNIALLGGDQAVIQKILGELANWNSALIDTLIRDIRENHNYKRIPVIWTVAYNAELFGARNDIDSFIEKLKSALRFEAQFKFEVNMPDINNITEVVVPLEFEPHAGNRYTCSGSGTGMYLQALVDDPDSSVATAPYPVQVFVKEFDPCSGNVSIGLDRFGSDGDTVTFTTEDDSITKPWPISRDAGMSLFNDELQDGIYLFKLDVQNGSTNAVDGTIQRTVHEIVHGTLTVKLIHK